MKKAHHWLLGGLGIPHLANIACVYAIPQPDATVESGKQKCLKPKPAKPKRPIDTLHKANGVRSPDKTSSTVIGHTSSLLPKSVTSLREDGDLYTNSEDSEFSIIPSIESSASQESVSTSGAEDYSDSSASPRPTPYASPHLDWSQARVLRVLDNILQWDCVAFCLIDRERFKLDLQTGETTYCAPALVNALLALSAVVFRHNIIEEVANRETGKPAWDVLSATLAGEAIHTLHRGTWLPETIPEIQALGVLALYCACNSWKEESRNFAMEFAEAIRKFCVQNANLGSEPTSTRRITASTYCGAISLNRYNMSLPPDWYEVPDGSPGCKDGRVDGQSWTEHLLRPTLVNDVFVPEPDARGDDLYVVAAELYQLVEQVFKTCCVPEKDRTFADATVTYIKGLEWYQNFFKYSEAYTGREPLIYFVHTYYHFCILCLFSPYMMDPTIVISCGSPPGKICEEAAHSILKLMRLHDSLAGDTEPVGFMNSFKSASLKFLDSYRKIQ
ncbi:Conidial development protein fluffy [Beauveria bassiana D1-5]|uniref:Conidial development protein fluffy n=1 Tax=Beauveria bassiana D1-5 TaxID=1245745 RepID=A0A0A2VRI8_BEABA|nr:Conidial development protein fluffy [Beauveria bassiana D1-5]